LQLVSTELLEHCIVSTVDGIIAVCRAMRAPRCVCETPGTHVLHWRGTCGAFLWYDLAFRLLGQYNITGWCCGCCHLPGSPIVS
jgi:hypothetical protein